MTTLPCPTPIAPRPHLTDRSVLAETATGAVGGGEVLTLRRSSSTGRVWTATVAHDGRTSDVRMDTRLRTAIVVPRPAADLPLAA